MSSCCRALEANEGKMKVCWTLCHVLGMWFLIECSGISNDNCFKPLENLKITILIFFSEKNCRAFNFLSPFLNHLSTALKT